MENGWEWKKKKGATLGFPSVPADCRIAHMNGPIVLVGHAAADLVVVVAEPYQMDDPYLMAVFPCRLHLDLDSRTAIRKM